jgi:hypothetical protein
MVIKIVSTVLGIAGLAWLVLLFSSKGILVGERVEERTLHRRLVCTYFTGSGNVRKEYLYSETGTIGRAVCPRWYTVPAAQ